MERAKQFYHGVLGLPYSGEHKGNKMVFFRADDHHNLALFLSDKIDNTAPSLDHVAFQLQGGKRELDLAQVELESIGIESAGDASAVLSEIVTLTTITAVDKDTVAVMNKVAASFAEVDFQSHDHLPYA